MTRRRAAVGLAVAALVATGCAGAVGDAPPSTDAPSFEDVARDVGVTAEPCAEGDPARGCIYLGSITDRSGPFAVFGDAILDGQRRFWRRVNDGGGVGGLFDVDATTHVLDGGYDEQRHAHAYRSLEPFVLAFASSVGTDTTLAIADAAGADGVLLVPISWWAGWAQHDGVLESGSSTCIDALNGVGAFIADEPDAPVLLVKLRGTYGEDVHAGATRALRGRDPVGLEVVEVDPVDRGGSVDDAVAAVVAQADGLVVLAVGPRELGEIVARGSLGGFAGRYLAHAAAFLPQLLATSAGQALADQLDVVAPYGPFGSETAAHDALARSYGGGEAPPNDGVTAGWVSQYPLLAALERAVADGDVTRRGLRAAARVASVDAEGALPLRRGSEDPAAAGGSADRLVRRSVLARPADAPTGLRQVGELHVPAADIIDPALSCALASPDRPAEARPT